MYKLSKLGGGGGGDIGQNPKEQQFRETLPNPHYLLLRLIVSGPIGKEGWAMLAEALGLLPPLAPAPPPPLNLNFDLDLDLDLDDPLNNQGFRSFTVLSWRSNSSPQKFMLGGRRQDVKAVFDALPVGSFWYVKGFKEGWIWKYQWNKNSGEDWKKLEHYMDLDTEEPIPVPRSILIDQIRAWSNAICQRFHTSCDPKRHIFGKELRMGDVFLI